jgi:TolB-like protein
MLLPCLAPCVCAGKIAIAVLSLTNTTGVSSGASELISDRLRIELVNTGAFTVMERSQMQEVLREQGFQQSGAYSDEGCMVEIGRMLGVQQLVAGSIGRLGSLHMLNVRVIDMRTARIVKVVSEDIRGEIEEVVEVLPGIARRLASDESSPSREPAREAAPAPQPAAEPPREPSCDKPVYLEALNLTTAQLGLKLTDEEYVRLNEEITDDLLDGLNECFGDEDNVESAAAQQLRALDGCNAVIVRVVFDSYTTKPEARGQIEGTATVFLDFYEGTAAAKPAFRAKVSRTGARHWGEYEPFENAFEEIGESIEEDLCRDNYLKALKKKMP